MADASSGTLRQLQPQWNKAMVAASIAISFLGAFTSTQLVCHARISSNFTNVFLWSISGSLVFGFSTIWCLHEVAMLAYEFDLPIGIDAFLTIASAFLAVFFTFLAVATDLLWDRYRYRRRRARRFQRPKRLQPKQLFHTFFQPSCRPNQSSTPLLQVQDVDDDDVAHLHSISADTNSELNSPSYPPEDHEELVQILPRRNELLSPHSVSKLPPIGTSDSFPSDEETARSVPERTPSVSCNSMSSDYSNFRRTSSSGLSSTLGIVYRKGADPARNAFISTAKLLYRGCTRPNVAKGFLWSLAITGMHYVGILALRIPMGYFKINPWLFVLSALISWAVCAVGCILMSQMETHLGQQVLFSIIASGGVAAMHFTGMKATTFWSTAPVSEVRGFPPALPNSVVGIAFVTCIVANVLVAHSATLSRNKLAEIFWTRKELWRAIALKEHAEADARARSEFIASASHEIRTPLHHLQGYSDLLAQTDLTEEGRALLNSIQRATKTLSLITNNVLDWSKFEQSSGESYRPTAVDIRAICESIIVLLPNVDDEHSVELYVVVAPDVPSTLFLDETWIHRILMNLLSNALKFTHQGYILLSIVLRGDTLVATIDDTGCGLDPAFMPEMWKPFKQGEVRGSARGTGLGLSIIKQLLSHMNGHIEVESRYVHSEGVGPQNSGTTFTVTLPMIQAAIPRPLPDLIDERPKLALLSGGTCDRALHGLSVCWDTFGFEVVQVKSVSQLAEMHSESEAGRSWKYIWADLDFLNANPSEFHQLCRSEQKWLVLVPYATHDSLEGLPGILSAPNFILLQKPLLWHTFERRIRQRKESPTRALRFARGVKVLNGTARTNGLNDNDLKMMGQDAEDLELETVNRTDERSKGVVLIVEDNPINQRLGRKMLVSLGYTVLTASNGQEAIDMLKKADPHDCTSASLANGTTTTGDLINDGTTPTVTNSSDSISSPLNPTASQVVPPRSPSPYHVDLILMDQSMPVKDGITATREIRGYEAMGLLKKRCKGRVPIVAVTAVVNGEAKKQFREAGADDFLAKPLSLGRLREVIGGFLDNEESE